MPLYLNRQIDRTATTTTATKTSTTTTTRLEHFHGAIEGQI
jgi:hypothetical protein